MQFIAYAKGINATELILPILWSSVTEDYLFLDKQLVSQALEYQHEDWSDLRFKQRDSEEYMRAINRMAKRLIAANQNILKRAETMQANLSTSAIGADEDDQDTQHFFLESVAKLDEWSKELTSCLGEMTVDIESIGTIANDGTKEMNQAQSRGNGVKAALAITKRMADKLVVVANKYEEEANACSKLINDINPDMGAIISTLLDGVGEESDREKTQDSICEMSDNALTAKGQIDDFIGKVQLVKSLSRSLYPPLKIIERASVTFTGSLSTVGEWGAALRQ